MAMKITCENDEYDDVLNSNGASIPPHTCPDIDDVLSQIRDALKTASTAHRNYESVTDLADQIDRDLWGISDKLESVRQANHQLRTSAEYWKNVFERNVSIEGEESCG